MSEVKVHNRKVFEPPRSSKTLRTVEHFASALYGWVFFPLTSESGTWAGSRFPAGRTRTAAQVRLTHHRSAPVPLSRPPVFCRRRRKQLGRQRRRRRRRRRAGTALDALREAGQVWRGAADGGPTHGQREERAVQRISSRNPAEPLPES